MFEGRSSRGKEPGGRVKELGGRSRRGERREGNEHGILGGSDGRVASAEWERGEKLFAKRVQG